MTEPIEIHKIPGVEYEELHKIVSFEGFDFRNFFRHEQTILKPRLERKGYKNIKFLMGEKDSFGPLTRVCHCNDKDGHKRYFIYG